MHREVSDGKHLSAREGCDSPQPRTPSFLEACKRASSATVLHFWRSKSHLPVFCNGRVYAPPCSCSIQEQLGNSVFTGPIPPLGVMTAAPGGGSASPPRTARSATAVPSKPFANSPRLNVLSNKKRGPAYSLSGRTEIKTDNLGPGPGECWRGVSPCHPPNPPPFRRLHLRPLRRAQACTHALRCPRPYSAKERELKVRACWYTGAYSPGAATARKAPSYSMTARTEQKDTVFAPGPGAYNPDGKLRKQIPITMTSRNFVKSANASDPGPGAQRQRKVCGRVCASRTEPPLAGAYTPVNPTFVSSQWTMLGRGSVDKDRQQTPGPLDYKPEKPQSARASTIHGKLKYADSAAVKNPGVVPEDEKRVLLLHFVVLSYRKQSKG